MQNGMKTLRPRENTMQNTIEHNTSYETQRPCVKTARNAMKSGAPMSENDAKRDENRAPICENVAGRDESVAPMCENYAQCDENAAPMCENHAKRDKSGAPMCENDAKRYCMKTLHENAMNTKDLMEEKNLAGSTTKSLTS